MSLPPIEYIHTHTCTYACMSYNSAWDYNQYIPMTKPRRAPALYYIITCVSRQYPKHMWLLTQNFNEKYTTMHTRTCRDLFLYTLQRHLFYTYDANFNVHSTQSGEIRGDPACMDTHIALPTCLTAAWRIISPINAHLSTVTLTYLCKSFDLVKKNRLISKFNQRLRSGKGEWS